MTNRELKELEQRFMTRQRLDDTDAEELRRALLSDDGKLSRKEVNFLVKLREKVRDRTPGFERFFYKALRIHLLDDDLLSATEEKWLRDVLFSDDELDERETELLCQLRDRARLVNPEFEYLLSTCFEARPKESGVR